jgi:hypothetical protein
MDQSSQGVVPNTDGAEEEVEEESAEQHHPAPPLKVKGNKRRMKIHSLVHNDQVVFEKEEINLIATNFYKDLFGPPSGTHTNMDNFVMDRLNEDDRVKLTSPLSLEELKKVVFYLKHNSAPVPYGLPTEFFQDIWDLIKKEMFDMCINFWKGIPDIKRLNYGMLILLPKMIMQKK